MRSQYRRLYGRSVSAVVSWIFLPLLQLVWADAGYRGSLIEWAKRMLGWRVDIVPPPEKGKGFVLAARRWVVERTFAWLGKWRRLTRT